MEARKLTIRKVYFIRMVKNWILIYIRVLIYNDLIKTAQQIYLIKSLNNCLYIKKVNVRTLISKKKLKFPQFMRKIPDLRIIPHNICAVLMNL